MKKRLLALLLLTGLLSAALTGCGGGSTEQASEDGQTADGSTGARAQANEIVTAATEQAQQILDNATSDANDIRIGAMQYTDDLLANAESIIGHTLDSYTTKYDGLVNSLQECYDMVRNNRSELEIPEQSSRGLEAEYGSEETVPEQEEYDLSENIELE